MVFSSVRINAGSLKIVGEFEVELEGKSCAHLSETHAGIGALTRPVLATSMHEDSLDPHPVRMQAHVFFRYGLLN
jgi:hypothetical protein